MAEPKVNFATPEIRDEVRAREREVAESLRGVVRISGQQYRRAGSVAGARANVLAGDTRGAANLPKASGLISENVIYGKGGAKNVRFGTSGKAKRPSQRQRRR